MQITQNFQIGELVKWFESYASTDLVKDAGVGVLLDIEKIYNIKSFKIFRIKKGDTVIIYENQIEKLNRSKK